jgi:hypothetical protein
MDYPQTHGRNYGILTLILVILMFVVCADCWQKSREIQRLEGEVERLSKQLKEK